MSKTTTPLSLQLYTVRDLTARDFVATVAEVARIGYAGVELAGYGNLANPGEVRRVLDDLGLKVSGSHTAVETLERDLNPVLDDNETLGNRTIIIPWVDEQRRQDADGWKRFANTLNTLGARCRDRGFTIAYHNHSFEFQQFDGRSGLDILWENADPQLVRAELDVYWLAHGGQDPLAYIEKLGQRTLLLHLKDMAPGPERRFAPVGQGIIDFPPILAAGERLKVQWNVVEQDDTYNTPPLEAARISFQYLTS